MYDAFGRRLPADSSTTAGLFSADVTFVTLSEPSKELLAQVAIQLQGQDVTSVYVLLPPPNTPPTALAKAGRRTEENSCPKAENQKKVGFSALWLQRKLGWKSMEEYREQ